MKKILFFIAILFFVQTIVAQITNVSPQSMGVGFGTKILMADGSEKNIEDIKEGEAVKIYDIDSLKLGASKVKRLILTGGHLIELTFTGNKWIHCSRNQPFFTKQSTGENVQIGEKVVVSSTKKIWAAQDNNGSENGIEKLQIKDNVYFVNALGIGSIGLQNIEFLPTRSARRIYTLELETGNSFIANGFIVKAK